MGKHFDLGKSWNTAKMAENEGFQKDTCGVQWFLMLFIWFPLQHLAGHYGGAWQLQKYEFPAFPGPVIITTNCLVEPLNSYKSRLFTLNETGWSGVRLVSDNILNLKNEQFNSEASTFNTSIKTREHTLWRRHLFKRSERKRMTRSLGC